MQACVAGAPELEGKERIIVRVGMKFYPVVRTGKGQQVLDETTPGQTHDAAMEWWREEVRSAKRFAEQTVKERDEEKIAHDDISILTEIRNQVSQRPSLQDVLKSIEDVEALYGMAENG